MPFKLDKKKRKKKKKNITRYSSLSIIYFQRITNFYTAEVKIVIENILLRKND